MSPYCRKIEEIGKLMNIRPILPKDESRAPVFIFEDHRMSFVPIWAAHKDSIFSKPPILIRFDAHNDYDERVDFKEYVGTLKTTEDVLTFCNFKLGAIDNDWVGAVIDMGYVSHVITFFIDKEHYDSEKFEKRDGHYLIWLRRLSDQLRSHDGFFNDIARSNDFREYRNALAWEPLRGFSDDQEIWLDIDFDFAVHRLQNGLCMPWRREDFIKEFYEPMPGFNGIRTSVDFMRSIIPNCRLITLATEPAFSCGIKGVYEIGTELEKVFWEAGLEMEIVSKDIPFYYYI